MALSYLHDLGYDALSWIPRHVVHELAQINPLIRKNLSLVAYRCCHRYTTKRRSAPSKPIRQASHFWVLPWLPCKRLSSFVGYYSSFETYGSSFLFPVISRKPKLDYSCFTFTCRNIRSNIFTAWFSISAASRLASALGIDTVCNLAGSSKNQTIAFSDISSHDGVWCGASF